MKLLIVIAFAIAAVHAENVAFNKLVTGHGKDLNHVTDGDANTCMVGGPVNNLAITIDLGKEVTTESIVMTLGVDHKRKFKDTVLRLGNSPNAKENPICGRIDENRSEVRNVVACEATGRYLSITKLGRKRWMVLCEIEVNVAESDPVNIALNKPVRGPGKVDPNLLTDGKTDTCRTTGQRNNAHVTINLASHHDVTKVVLTLHSGATRKFSQTVIRAGSNPNGKHNPICARINERKAPVIVERECVKNARYITVQKVGKARGMMLCEIEVYAEGEGPEVLPTEPAPPPIETTAAPTVPPIETTLPPTLPVETTAAPTTVEPTLAPTLPAETTAAPTTLDVTTVKTTEGCEFPPGLQSLAIGKPVSQSSEKMGGAAERAVDGDKTSSASTCTQTDREFQPHWMVDLGEIKDIHKVELTNRMDRFYRIRNAEVRVGNSPNFEENQVCGQRVGGKRPRQETITVTCGCDVAVKGRYVSVQLIDFKDKDQILHLCEVDVLGF